MTNDARIESIIIYVFPLNTLLHVPAFARMGYQAEVHHPFEAYGYVLFLPRSTYFRNGASTCSLSISAEPCHLFSTVIKFLYLYCVMIEQLSCLEEWHNLTEDTYLFLVKTYRI